MTDGIVVAAVTKGFSVLSEVIFKNFSDYAGRSARGLLEDFKKGFSEILEVTFLKCTKIKTILNPQVQVNFFDIYVDQFFSGNGARISGESLADTVRAGKNTVIYGTGGGGKSMFMRYLWLYLCENGGGRIPFFIELRNLNQLSDTNLVVYIYHTITKMQASVTQDVFERSISRGDFVFILDGFDEILVEKRQDIERQILSLAENNPKSCFVVSGRPDERFDGWQPFNCYRVEALTRDQAISVVSKAEFDQEYKDKLIQRIRHSLFDTHQSFLSNPLLTTMMLVAFAHNPNIPTQMHLFYHQVFDALYHRHDLMKGGFQREYRCGLGVEQLIRVISYYSLITYYSQKYEFNSMEMMEFARNALRLESLEKNADDLIRDMMENLCLLQQDGLSYTYTHRSLQEYFSAYCIARVTEKNIELLLSRFGRRYNDQVLKMTFDMNPELVVEKYILPMSRKYEATIRAFRRTGGTARFLEAMGARFEISIMRRNEYIIRFEAGGELEDFVLALQKIKTPIERSRKVNRSNDSVSVLRLYQVLGGKINMKISASDGKFIFSVDKDISGINFDFYEWFRETEMYSYLRRLHEHLYLTSDYFAKISADKNNAMNEILGLL